MSSVSHCDDLWQEIITEQSLKTILHSKLKQSRVKGIDRLNIYQFFHQSDQHINTIQKKCLDGSCKFYLSM